MKLEDLVKQLLSEGLFSNGVDYDKENDSLCYSIDGFAKSGQGTLQMKKDGKIHLMTRYGQDDVIENIKDFLSVAYQWDSDYCIKDDSIYSCYGVSPEWKNLYKKYGFNSDIFK